jgi:mannitol 2-dehydrogenase
MAVAGWFRFLQGVVDDPLADRLGAAARAGGADPRPLLAACPGFGELSADDEFATSLEEASTELDRHGVRAAIRSRLSEEALAA